MIDNITFKATYVDTLREVVISAVHGAGGSYHIFMDDYFIGSVGKRFDKFIVYWAEPGEKSVFNWELSDFGVIEQDIVMSKLVDAGFVDAKDIYNFNLQ